MFCHAATTRYMQHVAYLRHSALCTMLWKPVKTRVMSDMLLHCSLPQWNILIPHLAFLTNSTFIRRQKSFIISILSFNNCLIKYNRIKNLKAIVFNTFYDQLYVRDNGFPKHILIRIQIQCTAFGRHFQIRLPKQGHDFKSDLEGFREL